MKLPIIDIVSFAQNAEDVVLYRTFKKRPPGTYIDLGAGHPVFGSVTKNLADMLLWRGVEVEANSEMSMLLSKNRPNSLIFNVAVSDKDDIELFTETPDNWAMSALSSTANRNQFIEEKNTITKNIKTQTLNSILTEAKIDQNFELLKVDIEGAEDKVFKSFDFKYWKPKVIVTEIVTPHDFIRIEKLEDLITSQGYTHCLFDGINSFFARCEELDLIKSLSIPANVHDKYIPFIWWNLLSDEFKKNYTNILDKLNSTM